MQDKTKMTQRELKESIKNDPNLTDSEKARAIHQMEKPYQELSDEELLQLVRDFVAENGKLPVRTDLIYDNVLKQRFGPWGRMLEKAGVKEVSEVYLDRRRRRREKRERYKEYRRQKREQQAAEAERLAQTAETEEATKTVGLVTEPEIK